MQIDMTQQSPRASHHAIFVVVPRFNITTLITMIEAMRIANYLAPEPLFSWDIVSFDGSKVAASNGMTTTVSTDPDSLHPSEFVFVLGSWGTEHYNNRALTAWLRKRARAGENICGVELGCYIIARAGLLDLKPATTHWSWLSGFRESFDRVDVQDCLFTMEGKTMTCSGGLAGIDLMLRLIERSHGSSFSGEIADQMLHHPIRNANAPQRSTMGRSTETMLPLVREAMTLIEENIEEPLSVPAISEALDVSQRQLERQFKKHVGCTVVQFGLLRRLQNARLLLISTELSVREIATASGFNTLSHFAYSFGKFFGRRPSEYREAWPANEPAPSWPGSLSDFLSTLKKIPTEG
ncbi:MAG: GlxA family transcriptional regulator [Planktotalea sp.]|jgi:transcriptional regulator GlxA family with amidase domain|uniref:GlxA family transcriptional regulator n=1 Tax=Planktotalea sp. TaxID=2029877 RepID=UPI000183B10F|nr:GlxA family transcriptional regulator [Planktotalea sp.]EDZ43683.1 transcriptional regulator, AraC family [Rhodobacteraceae bacterium HTCC2083]MBT5823310.1 GlxA family transcriptional regulator [Paracoccaceae bacterium]MDG1076531.1 GlxA family transcriptional regulator [Planktotalea sp.]MDG1083976.1 GlxA family transcriptional regulator [Planktotalea sp.]HCW83056.1 GlxA family transcriptional regulator [Paracoccaceae bacterium]